MKSSRVVTFLLIAVFTLSLISSAQAAKEIVIVHDEMYDKVGQFTSLAVVNGYPAISYVDYTNQYLMYVRATDASGSAWGTPVLIDTTNIRAQTKLLVVDGRPAIAYFDSNKDHLKFVRASDADGTAWNDPIPVDESGNADWYLSMAIVNGKPAISYQDVTNQILMYVQSVDKQGSSWDVPVTVLASDTDDSLGSISMAVVDGNPAVTYYLYDDHGDGTFSEYAKYVRALDVNGANWGTPITIDPNGGWDFSLAVVDGRPAVAYSLWNETTDDLKFVRAADAQGTTWNTPKTLDSKGRKIGMFASLTIVNGLPAIAYVQNGSGHPDLRYVAANDAAGNIWSLPMVVDSDAGWYLSLAEVDGVAGISYYDNAISALKYAHFQLEQTIYLPLVIK
jgi:hypothetical protein